VTSIDPPTGRKARPAPRFARKQAEVRRGELIEAAIRCLGEGGVSGFTVERICREARVSRGLISHHFAGKDELLVQAYEAMTAYLAEVPFAGLDEPGLAPEARLAAAIEASFDPATFDRTRLRAWLGLWGELPGHPRLAALHRARYRRYREGLAEAIAATARKRRRKAEAARLAHSLVALIDGLWLECCLESGDEPLARARAACHALLEPHLGKIGA